MRAKYFIAKTAEEATTMACNFYDCQASDLQVDAVSGINAAVAGTPADADSFVFIALLGKPQEFANMDTSYSLYYEADGVYLEIYAKRGSGGPLDNDAMLYHLRRKNLSNYDLPSVQRLAEQGEGRIKIAPPQKEFIYGEDMTVVVSGDETEAVARLLEPEPGGPTLRLDDVKRKLAENGIIHGIDDNEINLWLAGKVYNEPHVVARATPPVDGEDGKLIFNFSTEERTGRPREIDSSGRVDYHSLDLYVPVTEGQLLVTRVAATEGSPGTSVKGNPLKQRPGKEAAMPRGKNVSLNPERTEMKSNYSGMVEFVNGTISVSNVYNIKGDCDISTGDIDFEGSVNISGSVRSGNKVKATDGIYVGGSIEAATLIAGGNVEVKGGMLGADKGMIEAKGAVSIMFVERGKISSDGPIKVDVSIHSVLETADTIHALGKRGAIIGGQASAGGDIVAGFIGALSNTKTSVEVGFLPRKRARVEELERDLERIRKDQIKLTQLDTYLEKSKGTLDQATWDKLYISGAENKKLNEETSAAHLAEIEQLRHEMANATNNKVHVLETAFAGSRVTIGASSFMVNDDINFATFKYSNGEVIYSTCEKSKTDYKT